MCGITGIVAPPGARVSTDTLQAHDGPDRPPRSGRRGLSLLGGHFVRKAAAAEPAQVGFGHRRLAILDLSDRGIQPISVDGRPDLDRLQRRDLQLSRAEGRAGGARLPVQDTDRYRSAAPELSHVGEDCLARLQGMYAFAIWDEPRGVLFCARDRLGIKPFYYTFANGWLHFASEIKALVALPGQPTPLDDDRRPQRS